MIMHGFDRKKGLIRYNFYYVRKIICNKKTETPCFIGFADFSSCNSLYKGEFYPQVHDRRTKSALFTLYLFTSVSRKLHGYFP